MRGIGGRDCAGRRHVLGVNLILNGVEIHNLKNHHEQKWICLIGPGWTLTRKSPPPLTYVKGGGLVYLCVYNELKPRTQYMSSRACVCI